MHGGSSHLIPSIVKDFVCPLQWVFDISCIVLSAYSTSDRLLLYRNRLARLEYRAQNAYIKGSCRRKVGRAKQQASEERRRAELSGDRM